MKFRSTLFALFVISVLLSSCAANSQPQAGPDLLSQAAVEATAIIQRAQATALVLQAQAQATALVQAANPVASTAVPGAEPASQVTVQAALPTVTPPAGATTSSKTPQAYSVELLRVGFAADGADIVVEFKASPSLARYWTQGNVSVTDEATGTVYDSIPIAPLIGALISRPAHEGQVGYVMFVNTPPGLQPGARVTVVLGNFKQEHVIVQ